MADNNPILNLYAGMNLGQVADPDILSDFNVAVDLTAIPYSNIRPDNGKWMNGHIYIVKDGWIGEWMDRWISGRAGISFNL